MTREPPADVDAEAGVLGAWLLGPTVGVDTWAATVELGLRPGDFYRPAHQHIAAAVASICERGDPVDTVLVADELRRDGLLDQVGGVEQLHGLQNATPSVTSIAKYARLVLGHARRRRVIHLAGEASDGAYDLDDERAERALAELARADTGRPDDDTWEPVALGPVLAGDVSTPTPRVLFRDDGRALFYAGVINGLHGDSGVGKGWLMCHAMAGELADGSSCMLIDYEDTVDSIVARLHNLGVSDALLTDQLVYLRPQDAFDRRAVDRVRRLIDTGTVGLVVVDSIGEAFAFEGLDENKDVDVGPWMRRVARPLAETGAAVVLVDHATKAADHPLHPSGSKRKRAAIGGASYLVEATVPLTRERGGRLRLRCAKDRHGHYGRGDVVANFVLTPNGDRLHANVYAPEDRGAAVADLPAILVARDVVRIVRDADEPLSKNALHGLLRTKASTDIKRAGVALAVDTGAVIETEGPRRAKLLSYGHDLDPELGT